MLLPEVSSAMLSSHKYVGYPHWDLISPLLGALDAHLNQGQWNEDWPLESGIKMAWDSPKSLTV
jgi:hypothetical protein